MTSTRFDVRVDVTAAAAVAEHLELAATVHVPRDVPKDGATVIFAFPGGGYNRDYFDLQLRGHHAYSQAEHHVSQGFVVIAIDHIGTGESDVPRAALDFAAIARVNAAAVSKLSGLLTTGRVAAGLAPVAVATKIGMGQSYGGLLLTILEGDHPSFDGVIFLGWSGIQSMPRTDIGMPTMAALELPPDSGLAHPLRTAMHFDDEPQDIVEQDMRGWPHRDGVPVPPWATPHMPGGPNSRSEVTPVDAGVVSDPAARIMCAVLSASGERDVCADPRLEPGAYASSPDITIFVLPRSGHMHNFASTRHVLWRRIDAWVRGVAGA
jgi:alpha-beta hydrolase superfamily lysophospholipase